MVKMTQCEVGCFFRFKIALFQCVWKENLESMMINVVEGANFLCLNFGSLKGKHEP